MGVISIVWGVVALLWTALAFLPFLGWGNWFMIPFAFVGALIGFVGMMVSGADQPSRGKTGLTINVAAIAIGVLRLSLGGGIF